MGSGWALLITVLTATSLVIGIANAVWQWFSKSGAAQTAKIKEIETKVISHDRRIQHVEGELKHLPTQRDVQELTVSVERLNGRLNTLETELTSFVHLVRRIDDHLREEKQ